MSSFPSPHRYRPALIGKLLNCFQTPKRSLSDAHSCWVSALSGCLFALWDTLSALSGRLSALWDMMSALSRRLFALCVKLSALSGRLFALCVKLSALSGHSSALSQNHYLPLNTGFRFSEKAINASTRSSVGNVISYAFRSIASPVCKSAIIPCLIANFAC